MFSNTLIWRSFSFKIAKKSLADLGDFSHLKISLIILICERIKASRFELK
jgi:hypothetical protein